MKLEPRVREFLEGPRYAVLATLNPSGSPHLTEMWYELRGDEIIFNTTDERAKRRNLEHDARVSLLVGAKKGDVVWRSLAYVRVDGVASGKEALEDICRFALHYDGPAEAAKVRVAYAKQSRITYAITIRRSYTKGL
jgi:PPOX class probable F420-dependent enzyme